MSQPVQVQVYRGGQLTGHVVLDGTKKVNRIGKTSSSQIKLDDPQASRVHAVIEVSRAGVWLIDMGSAVGTQLNGARVNKAKLNTGDQIAIGSTVLVVTIGAGMAATTAPPVAVAPAVAPLPGAVPQPQPAPPIQAAPQPAPMPAPMPAHPALQQQPPVAAPPVAAPPVAAPPAAVAPQPVVAPQPASSQPAPAPVVPAAGPPPSSLGPLSPSSPRPAAFGPTPAGMPTPRGSDPHLGANDPAVRRLRESARRNRMIGGGVIIGVVVVTALFVYLGTRGEGPELQEPANYSAFGVKDPKDAADDAAIDDAALDAAALDGALDDAATDDAATDDAATDDAATDDAATDDAATDDAATDEAATDDATDDAADAGTPVDAAPKPAPATFDATVARDEATYVYAKLTEEQTFSALAEKFYGNAGRATLIAEANPLASADQPMVAGTEVRVPRFLVHEVAPGNTLGGIAKAYLGDGKLYDKVFEANRDVLTSPTAIEVGMKLKIPLLRE